MRKIHETLYRTPELIKLFIVLCLFFYLFDDISPIGEGTSGRITGAIFAGLGAGLLTGLFRKPKAKKNKSNVTCNDES